MTTRQLPVSIPVRIARPMEVVGADAMLRAVKDGIRGIKDRIAGLGLPETPAAVVGPNPAFVFQPDSVAFPYDVAQANGATSLVNYIVRSGTTYSMPVKVGGSGIFLAHRFRITLRQRLVVNGTAFQNIADAPVSLMLNSFFPENLIYWTTKFSCFPVQPAPGMSPSINYRWNILDPVAGESYSDNLIPGSAILNRQFINVLDEDNTTPTVLLDGDWHRFEVPWRFDKAHQLNILFRPLTDIIQFDSSINGTAAAPTGPGLPYDDRISGLRNQAVTVQVEFQGERVGGNR